MASDVAFTLSVGGGSITCPANSATAKGFVVFTWDEWGDMVSNISNIRLAAGSTNVLIFEVYREQLPEGQ